MKKTIVKAGFWALGKGLQAGSKYDSLIKSEVLSLPENFTITLEVFDGQVFVSWQKQGNVLKYKGLKRAGNPDLLVRIKNLQTAFKMILARVGIAGTYAQRRIAIEGNTVDAMRLTRMMDRTEAYLFPRFMSKKLFKQRPVFGLREYWNNFLIYLSLLA